MNPLIIPPHQPLPDSFECTIPGDKSLSHRLAIMSALSDTTVTLTNFLTASDCLNTLSILSQLGVSIRRDNTTVSIDGVGKHGLTKPATTLDVGNSGTAIRLLAGLLSAQPFDSHLTGDASIQRRPMNRVTQPLTQMGACIHPEYAPLTISGRSLTSINYSLPVASAQVKSALLLAGLYANGDTVIHEPVPCRDHTERVFRSFGITLDTHQSHIKLSPPDAIRGPKTPVTIPSDLSSALFLIVLGLNKSWVFNHVGINPTRRAGLDYLLRLQAGIHITPDKPSTVLDEPTATIRLSPQQLTAAPMPVEWIPNVIDDIPILTIAALCNHQPIHITGAAELRLKESDRIETTAALARKLGAQVITQPDGFSVYPPDKFISFVYDCEHDHRLAMSAVVAALLTGVQASITGAASIATSFPTFFDVLDQLGITYYN